MVASATTGCRRHLPAVGAAGGLSRGVLRERLRQGRAIGIVVLADATTNVNVTMEAAGPGTQAESLDDLRPGEVGVRLETRLGSILLAIDAVHAPVTAANFLKYVDGGSLQRRTIPSRDAAGQLHAGAAEPADDGTDSGRHQSGRATRRFPPIPLERTTVTGLKHVVRHGLDGARNRRPTPRRRTSSFFSTISRRSTPAASGSTTSRAPRRSDACIFGLGVVRKIQQQPVQGQNLTPPLLILRASRVN